MRRHKRAVTTASVTGILALLTLALSTILISSAYSEEKEQRQLAQVAEGKEREQRHVAEEERDRSEHYLYMAHMLLAKQAWDAAALARGRELLNRQLPRPGRPDFRAWEWHYMQALYPIFSLGGPGQFVQSVVWSPDGKRFATAVTKVELPTPQSGSDPALITVWDADTRRPVTRWSAEISVFPNNRLGTPLVWSPDSQQLAAGGLGFIKVWQASTGEEVLSLGEENRCYLLSWTADGQRLVTMRIAVQAAERSFAVWDLKPRKILFTRRDPLGAFAFPPPCSPDGQWLLIRKPTEPEGFQNTILDTRTGKEVFKNTQTSVLEWSPDGNRLVMRKDQKIRILNIPDGREVVTFDLRTKRDIMMTWSPGGKRLLGSEFPFRSVGGPLQVFLWDASTGQELLSFEHTRDASADVHQGIHLDCFSPDGQRVASCFRNGTVKLWDAFTGQPYLVLRCAEAHPNSSPARPSWRPDGRHLWIGEGGKVEVWDAAVDHSNGLPLNVSADLWGVEVSWNSDGRRLAVAGQMRSSQPSWKKRQHRYAGEEEYPGVVTIWDTDTGEQQIAISAHPTYLTSSVFSPDGKLLATLGEDASQDEPGPVPGLKQSWAVIRIWEARNGRRIRQWRAQGIGSRLTWSPDGKLLASSGLEHTFNGRLIGHPNRADGKMGTLPAGKYEVIQYLRIWDAATGREVTNMRCPANMLRYAWSPKGGRFAGYGGGEVHIWDTQTWQVILRVGPVSPTNPLPVMVWSPDGTRIAVAGTNINVWDVTLGQVVLRLAGHSRGIDSLAWSPDGRRLVSLGKEKVLKFWDMRTGEQVLSLDGEFKADKVAWSPDGKRLAAWNSDEVRLWDTSKRDDWRPSRAQLHNQLALARATHKDTKLRDPVRAVELAQKAVELAPYRRVYHTTLGLAHYRAGDWQNAVAALERSMQLRGCGDGTLWFYLAMAYWQLSDKAQAHKWYDEAVRWMEQPGLEPYRKDPSRQEETFRHLRTETENLLFANKPPPKGNPSE